jgi:hypothetical protein
MGYPHPPHEKETVVLSAWRRDATPTKGGVMRGGYQALM